MIAQALLKLTTAARSLSLSCHNMLANRGFGRREALLLYAGSAEAFLALRRNFAASLTAVSATGYISGSGDRHLDNYLLHSASGALVPIDFGCASS